jgi:hypothetical protein
MVAEFTRIAARALREDLDPREMREMEMMFCTGFTIAFMTLVKLMKKESEAVNPDRSEFDRLVREIDEYHTEMEATDPANTTLRH